MSNGTFSVLIKKLDYFGDKITKKKPSDKIGQPFLLIICDYRYNPWLISTQRDT